MDTPEAIRMALCSGFDRAVPLDVTTLRFLPEVRQMCAADRCASYGKCWVCPPACGTLEECAARAAAFRQGMLVQTVGTLEDPFDYPGMSRAGKCHKRCFSRLIARMRRVCPTLLPLGAGGCRICKRCSFPQAPCRHPDKAFVSMEAAGLWVSDVCEKNHLPYNDGEGRLTFTGCVLF